MVTSTVSNTDRLMPSLALGPDSLYYDDRGHGPAVVFLHGLGQTAGDWKPQLDHFAADHRVIAIDALGHGQSSKPKGPYSIARMAGLTADLIRKTVGGPAHVVGLSMGGMIAFQLALDAPDTVGTLTIVNSGPHAVPRGFAEWFALNSRIAIVKWFGMRKMAEILAPRLFPDDAAKRAAFIEGLVANDRDAYLASLRAIIGWTVQDRIGRITAPTLVVASELDYSPPERKEEYVRLMPNAKMVVVPDTHHGLPMEDPETFNAVLADFLAVHA